jgi:hypothetical protein
LVGPLLFRVLLVSSMGHGPAAFKEGDVVRAVRAIAKATGQLPADVRFHPEGGFTVVIGKAGDRQSVRLNDNNDVEDWINKHVHQS